MQGNTVLVNVYILKEDRDYLKTRSPVRGDYSKEIREAVHQRVLELKNIERLRQRNEEL